MPPKCGLCTHPDRKVIEAMLQVQSVREVALATGVSRDQIARHQAHADWSKVVAAQPVEAKVVKGAPTFIEFCEDILKLTFTRGQRVLARVAFGDEDPRDLGDDAEFAIGLFGGVETIPQGARRQVVLRLGRGSGKTTLCVAYGLWRIEYADLSMCGPGDEAVVMIVAPLKTISLNDVNMGEAMAKNTPSISPRVKVANSERITIERRGDKRRASLLCVPKSGGGAAARGKSVAALILDESEFVSTSAEERAVSDVDLIGAATPRLIPTGRVFLISTPYPFPSETSRLYKSDFGAPKSAMVAKATTLQMREGDANYEMMFAQELARDSENARREYLCEETAVAGSFLSPEQVDGCVGAIEATSTRVSCGMDLAFVADSSACVLVERQGCKVVVTALEMLSPKPKEPLVPSDVITRFSILATQAHCFGAMADQWYLESVRETAVKLGLAVTAGPTHTAFEVAMLYMRDLIRNKQLVLPPHPQLLDQLKSILSSAKAGGGVTLTLPRRMGSGHADLIPALCYACWMDRCKEGPLAPPGQTMPARGLAKGFERW